jgi:NADH dehydrogenase/NADH:ubiquinone oxidoreductase subunit G
MHCDCRKVSSCKLRDYGQEYQVNQKNYQTGERNLVQKLFTHETVVYEAEKCIRCGLCVDITEKDGEDLGLTYVGRGFDVRIGVPFNEELGSTLTKVAEKCAKHCPTGAIALK